MEPDAFFREATLRICGNLEIEESAYLVTEPGTLLPHYLETTAKFRATLHRPGEADIIVSGGRGIKGPENYELIEKLAALELSLREPAAAEEDFILPVFQDTGEQ